MPISRAEMAFAAAGVALIGSQAWLIWATTGLTHANAATLQAVLPLVLGLPLMTGLLLLAAPRLAAVPPTRFALAVLFVAGLAMRLAWFGTPPPLEDDYFRYLWDGAVVAHVLDPYAYSPQTFFRPGDGPAAYAAIADRAQEILRKINFPDMRTIYPGVAQIAFAAAHFIAPFKVDGLRLVFLASEIATLALLISFLGHLGRSPLYSLLYWWNPFIAHALVGLAHVDALVPPFVLAALLAASQGRTIFGLTLLGLGAGVKIWPLLLAPLILWPLLRSPKRLVKATLWFGLVLLMTLGPVLYSATRPGSGLSAYAAGWSNNNAVYAWLLYAFQLALGSWEAAERLVRPMLGIAAACIALAAATRGDDTLASLSRRALVVAATTFYISPAQFPWYAVWFLPLAVVCGNWPLLGASALLPAYYLFYPLWPVQNGVWYFYGTAFIHALPVFGGLIFIWYRGRKPPPGYEA